MRCPWATREPEIDYHDREWGIPVYDDRRLFELLTLEGAQAGLRWATILRKRAGYRRVFRDFDPDAVAGFDAATIETAVRDPGIVRHRGKILATVGNAAAVRAVRRTHGTFAAYLWAFVDGRPLVGAIPAAEPAPPTSPLSDHVAADLRARGFRFVGSTTVHAFLQACGIRNDHRRECFRSAES